MTMSAEGQEDLPKTMAVIAVTVPKLAWKVGWTYLKAKKGRQRNAKHFTRAMVEGGMPPEAAKQLALDFEADLSVRNFVEKIGSVVPRKSVFLSPGK